jgi:hypothetical protein
VINRVKLILEQDEYSALLKVATSELRNPADQARHILRQDLARRGLLPADASQTEAPKPVIDGWGRVIGGSNGNS